VRNLKLKNSSGIGLGIGAGAGAGTAAGFFSGPTSCFVQCSVGKVQHRTKAVQVFLRNMFLFFL